MTSLLAKADVSNPRPNGEAAKTATPSSRQVARRSVPYSPSTSMTKGEYSIWTAATGAILMARRRVVEEMAERPIYLILPSLDYCQNV
jgi:hypothetical protein